jgi:hypothetical protein
MACLVMALLESHGCDICRVQYFYSVHQYTWHGGVAGGQVGRFYTPTNSISAGRGHVNSGAAAGGDSSMSLQVLLVNQIEYYFRQVQMLCPHCSCRVPLFSDQSQL